MLNTDVREKIRYRYQVFTNSRSGWPFFTSASMPIRVYSEIVLGKIAQDDAIAQQLNLPLRADIQRARQFIVEGGFGRLFAELDKGTLLPAIGVPLISLGLASRDNERR